MENTQENTRVGFSDWEQFAKKIQRKETTAITTAISFTWKENLCTLCTRKGRRGIVSLILIFENSYESLYLIRYLGSNVYLKVLPVKLFLLQLANNSFFFFSGESITAVINWASDIWCRNGNCCPMWVLRWFGFNFKVGKLYKRVGIKQTQEVESGLNALY